MRLRSCVWIAGGLLLGCLIGGCDEDDPGGRHELTILDFEITPYNINEGGSVTFTVRVEDLDGVGDIVGGTLRSENTDQVYGQFVQTAEESDTVAAYELTMSWDEINHVEPIEYGPGTSSQRHFTAQFTDESMNVDNMSNSLTFDCDTGIGEGACAGVCTNLNEDASNCGACGAACPTEYYCSDGTCLNPQLTDCQDSISQTCDTVCASLGQECVMGCGQDAHAAWLGYTDAAACDAEDNPVTNYACHVSPDTVPDPIIGAFRCCCNLPAD
jgi:hypothetical protein